MNSKNSRIKTLSGYVSNRVQCNKQQLANTTDAINDYLNRIEDYVEKIRRREYCYIDNIKAISELASRLRVLLELDLMLNTNLSVSTHIEKELELLENDAK